METDEKALYKVERINLELDETTSEKEFFEQLISTLKQYSEKHPERFFLEVKNPPVWLELITKMGDEELEEWLRYRVNEYYSSIQEKHKENIKAIRLNELWEEIKGASYFLGFTGLSVALGYSLDKIGLFEFGFYLVATALLIPRAMKSYMRSGDLLALRGEEEFRYEEVAKEKEKMLEMLENANVEIELNY